MLKFKKLVALLSAVVMLFSMGCMGALADENRNEELTIIDGMIDYTIYDSDMVYIQEHADLTAQYNARLNTARALSTTYASWNWNNGIYSFTSKNAAGITPGYSFTPVTNSMYFNAEVTNVNAAPYMTVNKLLSDGSLSYVGSYNITSIGGNSYQWTNYKRSLNAGQKYIFGLWANSNWTFASMDIYKSAMN